MGERLLKERLSRVFDKALDETSLFVLSALTAISMLIPIGIFLAMWEISGLGQILNEKRPDKKITGEMIIVLCVLICMSLMVSCSLAGLKNFKQVLNDLSLYQSTIETTQNNLLRGFAEKLPIIRKIKTYIRASVWIMSTPSISGLLSIFIVRYESDLQRWAWIGVGLLVMVYASIFTLCLIIGKHNNQLKKWWKGMDHPWK